MKKKERLAWTTLLMVLIAINISLFIFNAYNLHHNVIDSLEVIKIRERAKINKAREEAWLEGLEVGHEACDGYCSYCSYLYQKNLEANK